MARRAGGTIFLPHKGFAPGPSARQLSPEFSPDLQNVRLEEGRIRTREGFVRLNTAAYGGAILGMKQFIKRSGENWWLTVEDLPSGAAIIAREGPAAIDAFFVSGHNAVAQGGEVSKTTDSGATWTDKLYGTAIYDCLGTMIRTPSGYFLAAPYTGGGNCPGLVYRSIDLGENWSTITIQADTAVNQFAARLYSWTTGLTFAIGRFNDGTGVARYSVVKSTNEGATWGTPVILDTSTPDELDRQYTMWRDPDSPNRILAAYSAAWNDPMVKYSDDDGATWTASNLVAGNNANCGNAAGFARTSNGYLYCAYYKYSDWVYHVAESQDYGATWTRVSTYWPAGARPELINGMMCLENDVILMWGYYGSTYAAVWQSTDHGITWTLRSNWSISLATGGGLREIRTDSDGNFYATVPADDTVRKSIDQGKNWTDWATNVIGGANSTCWDWVQVNT